MNKMVEELKKCKVFYVATMDGDQPRVRPFSSVMEYEGKLYLCTNNTKKVWKQLEINPKVEICGMNNQGEWVRISGKLINDDRQEAKDAMLDDPTCPSNIYQKDSSIFRVMYLDQSKGMKYSFKGEPVEIK